MGLDMYLDKRHYVRTFDSTPPDARFSVSVTRGGRPYPALKPERIKYIEEEVAYWRKANQIHNWFVVNVQEGRDECQDSEVSTEQIGELLGLVTKVLADRSLAPELLPTQAGFFFGSTEYDESYFEDLQYTQETLTSILAEMAEIDKSDYYAWLQYHASW